MSNEPDQLQVRPVSCFAFLAAVVFVVGCSGGPGTPAVSEESADVAVEPTLSAGPLTPDAPTSSVPLDADPESRPVVSSVPAIEGYGDFAGWEYFDIDWTEVVRLTVECANDHGFPVRVVPPGDGISYAEVPLEQNSRASAFVGACKAGLNLPAYRPPSTEQIRQQYYRLLEVKECLESEGYDIAEPTSIEVFVDSWAQGPWHPYLTLVNTVSIDEWVRLHTVCPQP